MVDGLKNSIAALDQHAFATIFMLHRMESNELGTTGHRVADLRKTLQALRDDGVRFMAVEDLMLAVREKTVPDGPIASFTVDDGFVDQTDIAGPVFAEFDCPATYFLISGFLDGYLWPWDSQVDYVFRRCRRDKVELEVLGKPVSLYFQTDAHRHAGRRAFREFLKTLPHEYLDGILRDLSVAADVDIPHEPPAMYTPASWESVRRLREKGIRFAPHTVSHRIVSQMSDRDARFEVEHSYARVRDETGVCDRVFAWPNGKNVDFGSRETDVLAELGFIGSVNTEPMLVDLRADVRPDTLLTWGRFGLAETTAAARGLVGRLGRARVQISQFADVRFGGRRGIGQKLAGVRYALGGGQLRRDPIEWGRVDRLVFLCTGNICRSPYAEFHARSLGLNAISCGTRAIPHVVANHQAIQVASSRGIDMHAHRSRNTADVDYTRGDLVIGFDLSHARQLLDIADEQGCQVCLLGRFGDVHNVIADPYGCAPEYFQRCFRAIEACISELMSQWRQDDRAAPGNGAHDRADDWHNAIAAAPVDPLFNSRAWQEAWWTTYSEPSHRRDFVYGGRGDGPPAVLAAYSATRRFGGILNSRVLVNAGGNHWSLPRSARPIRSEHLSILLPEGSGDVRGSMEQLADATIACQWDEIILSDLDWDREENRCFVDALARRNVSIRTISECYSYCIDLDDGTDRYREELTASARRAMFNKRRILEGLGTVSVERIFASDDRAEPVRRELNRLFEARWGKPAISDHMARFLARLSDTHQPVIRKFSILSLNETPVSILHNAVVGNDLYNLHGAFDSEISTQISPMILHFGYDLEAEAEAGIGRYWLLAGDGRSTNYKERLANRRKSMRSIHGIRHRGLRSVYAVADRIGIRRPPGGEFE